MYFYFFRFCFCFLFYFCGIILVLWFLEMDCIKKYDVLNSNENIISEVQELVNIEGVCSNLDILKIFFDLDFNELKFIYEFFYFFNYDIIRFIKC